MIYRGFIWTTERLSVFPTGVLSEFYAIMTEDTDGRYGVPSCRTAAQITYWICVIRNQNTKPIGSPGFIEIKIVGPITNDCFNISGVPGSVIYYVMNVGGALFLVSSLWRRVAENEIILLEFCLAVATVTSSIDLA